MTDGSRFTELAGSMGFLEMMAVIVGLFSLVLLASSSVIGSSNIPVYGYRSWFEPALLVRIRFLTSSRDIIFDGCRKYGNLPFQIHRFGLDTTILPQKYLNELRLAPFSKLNETRALNSTGLVHKYTCGSVFVNSDLHFDIVKDKLMSDAPKYLKIASTELNYAWEVDIPRPQDWAEVDIQQKMSLLIARMTSKILLGSKACRDIEWLNLALGLSKDAFVLTLILTMFPTWLYPVVARLTPAWYKIKKYLRDGERIVTPLIDNHKNAVRMRAMGKEVQEEEGVLLHSMMDHGTEKENDYTEMSHRQCFLSLASIHSTSTTICNVLFDICAHPEWVPELRDEIDQVAAKFGGEFGSKEGLANLEKLDSFLVESLRYNPIVLLAPQRYAMEPYTFKDGWHVPAGTTISWANYYYQRDPSLVADPDRFDPMRSYRRRHSSPDQNSKHLAGQTDVNNLTFGYGRGACPGRLFAVGEIKTVVARLLSEFDFKFANGTTRPKNISLNELSVPHPAAKLMMRRREGIRPGVVAE